MDYTQTIPYRVSRDLAELVKFFSHRSLNCLNLICFMAPVVLLLLMVALGSLVENNKIFFNTSLSEINSKNTKT